ncbi:MAG: glycosyltransferase family 39 protein [Planctomycetota bacterium]
MSVEDLASSQSTRSTRRLYWPLLTGIFLIALLLRWLRGELTPILSVDGTTFIRLARLWQSGDVSIALSHDFHPLYSAGIAALGGLGLGFETAGRWIAQLASAALVFPMASIASRLGPPRVALATALFVACDPYPMRFGADVLSDPLCTFLWMSSLAVGLPAILAGGALRGAIAGLLSGLAYLTRPEGGEAAVVTMLLLGVALFKDRGSRRRTLLTAGALALGVAVCALPYLGWLTHARGEVTLSQKKDMVDLASHAASGEGGQSVLAHLFSTLFPTYLLLALIGWISGARKPRDLFFWATILTAGIHLALLSGLARTHGYVSRRHLIPILAVSTPWAAVGWELAARKLPKPHSKAWRYGLLLALALVPALIKNARPTRDDKLMLREMGHEIARRFGPDRTLATTRPRVAHYARATWVEIRPDADSPRSDAELLVLTGDEEERGWLAAAESEGFRVVLRLGEGERELILMIGESRAGR